MDAMGAAILSALLLLLALYIAWWRWKNVRLKRVAREWPRAEATIQTGALKKFIVPRFNSTLLPAFDFFYEVNAQRFSGRFALIPYSVAYDDAIITRLKNSKLPVCYDPKLPGRWKIPEKFIEGYEVRQKRGSHFLSLFVPD